MSRKKVLLVDDDLEFSSLMSSSLQERGFVFEIAHSGASGLVALANEEFDFVLLDWNLPDITGMELCREYRKMEGNAYIIFLTGRNNVIDKELAFESGGDDYISKPFEFRELIARMSAIERRQRIPTESSLHFSGLTLDSASGSVAFGDKKIKLTPHEVEILKLFFQNPGVIFKAEELGNLLKEPISNDFARQTIHRLRSKLKVLGLEGFIESQRGGGYRVDRG